jgi:xanthine dehydrogenase accessory factor
VTPSSLVVVRGGGDLGTGVAHRLVRAGYVVVVLEAGAPTAVRRRAAFCEAVRDGSTSVEGVEARLIGPAELAALGQTTHGSLEQGSAAGRSGWVPVVVDPAGETLTILRPAAVVDARMAKRNLGTAREDAPVTIGLGPGFVAGRDVDLVIETKRGHTMGRVIGEGPASADTGVPGAVGGVASERVLRAPAEGTFESRRVIGDLVAEGEAVGSVAGEPVLARIAGLIRGLIADGTAVGRGAKVGDVDPRGSEIDPASISDRARAIGGAVLEALLSKGVLPAPGRNGAR